MASDHIVFIVDDDLRIRESLVMLLESFGMNARAFGSATEYTASPLPEVPACLILDVELPDMNGLDLQSGLARGGHEHGSGPHIVFITGHGDVPSSVRAIKAGAVDFLTKPFKPEDLMRAVESALALNRCARAKNAELNDYRQRLSTLTPRELEVLPLVASGLMNKQAAVALKISEGTLQIHRGNIMKKMRADSLADLVRVAVALGIKLAHRRHAG
jgi:FixJ family two-component response regulator